MSFLIRYIIKWIIQGWILSKIAKVIRRWLVKKYALEYSFNQNFTKSHEVDWENLRWFAVLASYAYKKDNNVIREKYKNFEVYVNTINEIKYIVLFDKDKREQYVSIRGTSNSHNALQDINFFKDKSFRLGIELHTGFHRTAEMIADDLITRLDKTWTTYVTGHSLGGAEAIIVAWYLDYSGHNVAECITFGQPKVTDVAMQILQSQLSPEYAILKEVIKKFTIVISIICLITPVNILFYAVAQRIRRK